MEPNNLVTIFGGSGFVGTQIVVTSRECPNCRLVYRPDGTLYFAQQWEADDNELSLWDIIPSLAVRTQDQQRLFVECGRKCTHADVFPPGTMVACCNSCNIP